jgi:aspartate/methionine/tyrosine aminotransferase
VEADNLRPANDELFSWVLGLGPKSKYNFTSSGLSEPNLSAMGVDTSFERFVSERVDHEKQFAKEVAELYRAEPENIVATSGGSEAIFLVYSALGDGRRAVVPLPNYPPMFTVPEALGIEVGNRLSALRARKTLVGLTDPNNPTGQVLTPETLEILMPTSRENDSTVFINETYKEFTFPVSPRSHFGAPNVVVCNTMTKFYGLGRLRVGWVMADKITSRRLLYAKWAVSGHDSEYSLWIATQVLRNRLKFAERAQGIVSRNIRLVRRFLAKTNDVTAKFGAAPFCLVHYEKGPGSVALARALLKKTGVLVAPGDFFGAPMAFRLCFTTEERTLRIGLDELSEFMNGLSK